MRDHHIIPAFTRGGIRGLKDSRTGRFVWLPTIAGAAGPPEPPAPVVDPPAPPADPPTDPPADPPAPPAPPADPPAGDPPGLGDPGKRALEQEREARRKAEQERKEAQDALKAREQQDMTEAERQAAQAEADKAKAAAATANARNANLLVQLAAKGLVGGQGQAAARLLDGIEYDETTDAPTNLDAAIEAAKATYGDAMFTAADPPKPTPPAINPGSGGQPGPEPNLTPEELEAAEKARMTPAQYEAMKDVHTYADWQAAQERLKAGSQQ